MGMFRNNNQWHSENHFNMDSATLDRINDKLSITNDAGIEGNQLKRFRGLKILFNNTMFKFQDNGKDTKEIEEIEKIIKEINNLLKRSPVYQHNKKLNIQFESIKIDDIEEKLDNFEKKLNIMFFKNGIINLKVIKKQYEVNEQW